MSHLLRSSARLVAGVMLGFAWTGVALPIAQAEVFSQNLGMVFVESNGFRYADSQFDAAPDPMTDDLSNFATVFDNFSLSVDPFITNFSWTGIYADLPGDDNGTGNIAPLADDFTVSIFTSPLPGVDNTIGNEFATFANVSANETELSDGVYSYSLDVAPLAVTLGENYWFSVVANMDADTPVGNEWGLAFSDSGDDNSVQDFQLEGDAFLTRFSDPFDYQFSVTASAVPEPATGLALALGCGVAAYRRRSRRRSADASAI